MGGEKPAFRQVYGLLIGSPPHGRGKAVVNVVTGAFPGITPAWAGKSKSSYFSCFPLKDHPRMGGEKILRQILRPPVLGSPPHGRGKVFTGILCLCFIGITPAWAGKSLQLSSLLQNF